MSLYRNLFILLISGIFLIGQWGCVTSPIPPSLEEPFRQQLGRIGVATASFVPKAEFAIPHPGYLERVGQDTLAGAGLGAGAGKAGCAGSAGNPAGLAVCLLLLLGAPIAGGVLGGLTGAVYEPFSSPEITKNIQETQTLFHQILTDLRMQETFRDVFLHEARTNTSQHFELLKDRGPQNIDETPDYEEPGEQGLDTLLELRIQSIGLMNGVGGHNAPLALFMKSRARLLRMSGKEEIYDETFYHRSEAKPYHEWAMNQAKLFQEAITQAYEDLAIHMVQDFFLRVPTTWPTAVSTMPFATDPSLLQPPLQWHSFSPQAVPEVSDLVTTIRYEIQIWDVSVPDVPIYVRKQLPDPVHTVDNPLEPCHTYSWNIRAAFQLDGSPRVTDWTAPETPQEDAPLSEACISYLAMRADLNGPIIDVSEGNLFSIQGPATVEHVQIPGITCPRGSHPLREKSKAAILTLAKNVAVTVLEEDKEGRKVGEVLVFPSGQALDKELVKNGLCQWDWRYPEKVELQDLEAEAKAAKRGVLWEEIQY